MPNIRLHPAKITLTVVFFLAFASLTSKGGEPADVLVVCPQYFRESLQPWVDYRASQGYTIHILSENQFAQSSQSEPAALFTDPMAIRDCIRRVAKEKPIKYLVIIGSAADGETVPADMVVPVEYLTAKVIQNFGPDEYIPSDNSYADLDGDGLPDIPCGRIPVRTKEELDEVVKKIIRYEESPKNSELLRRLNFVAGVGGFSRLIDSTIESTARMILDSAIPAGFDLRMTQASWKSPYCPDPFAFRAETIRGMNEGALFWVYIGHGQAEELDTLGTPLGHFPIWLENDSRYVKCSGTPPIAVFLACHTGAFDLDNPSLAESLSVKGDGPVAVIAATRTTMPYAMAVFSIELLEELFQNQPETLGMLVLNAKRNMLSEMTKGEHNSLKIDRIDFSNAKIPQRRLREMLESIAKLLDPTAGRLGDQRLDHLHLFHLLGDPLLRIPSPEPLALECPDRVKAGEMLEIRGRTSIRNAEVLFELAVPRIRATVPNPKRPECVLDETQRAEFASTYKKANDRVLALAKGACRNGEFTLRIKVPEKIDGEHTVRVFVQGSDTHAIGAKTVEIRP